MMKKSHTIKLADNDFIIFNPNDFQMIYSEDDISDDNNIASARNVESSDEGYDKLDIQAANICIAETCNLGCKYCFFNEGTYDSSQKIINIETLLNTFKQLQRYSISGIKSFGFYGGEPLLGFDVIKKFTKYVSDSTNKRPSFGIVTNGTLLTPEMFDFFDQYKFYVTISLDGFKQYNDEMRIAHDGSSVYDKIVSNLSMIKNRQFRLCAEATIAPNYLHDYKAGDIYDFMNMYFELGFDNVIPLVADIKDGYDDNLYEKITLFFEDLVEYTFKCMLDENDYTKPPVFIVKTISALAKKKYVNECKAGYKYVFVTANGDIFPCQMYYQNRINKMNDENGDLHITRAVVKRKDISTCQDCFCESLCMLWCPGSSNIYNGSDKSVIESRCYAQKSIINSTIKNIARMYRDQGKWGIIARNLLRYSDYYSIDSFLNGQ